VRNAHHQIVTMMLTAIALVSLGACTSTTPEPSPSVTSSPGTMKYFLESAEAEGVADDQQLEILRTAQQTQVISFEDYKEAVGRTLSCIADAGVRIDGPTTDESLGFPVIRYGFAGGLDATGTKPANPVPDQCIKQHSYYVENAYRAQPTSQDALDAILEQSRAAVQQCIDKAGITVDSDLPVRQWLAAIAGFGEPGINCIADQGITEF